MQQEGKEILIITTVIIVVVVIFLVVLFAIFQRRKNKLLYEKDQIRKNFEKEIATTQIEIREETLRNISWELHDNIGQLLTLAKIQMQQVTGNETKDVTDTITQCLTEVRSLSKLINPEFINNIGFIEVLRLEIERFNRLNYIDARMLIKGEKRDVNQKHGIIIFRILQEFFSNTIKHSKASELNVILNFKEEILEIVASDNGVGFEMENVHLNGIGLENMKSRIKLLNASLVLKSQPLKGTSLIIKYYL